MVNGTLIAYFVPDCLLKGFYYMFTVHIFAKMMSHDLS